MKQDNIKQANLPLNPDPKKDAAHEDKSINDSGKSQDEQHDNDYMAKLDEDPEKNSFDNNVQSNEEAQQKNKVRIDKPGS